jgi:hypothetical protein
MSLARRSFRRSMNMERMKMAVWCPLLNMYLLLRLQWLTALSYTYDDDQDRGEAKVKGEVASRREPPRRVQVNHPASRIIGDMNERTTRSRFRNNSHFAHAAFVATFEPKDIRHALSDHNWVNSMHEELENIERNQVWELVDPPPGCKPIGTKWVWKNKQGEKGEVVRNKSRLIA